MDGRSQGVVGRRRRPAGQDQAGRAPKGASDTTNEVFGYSIVQAESAAAATKMFGKDQPHVQMPGAWVEIIEIMPIPGM